MIQSDFVYNILYVYVSHHIILPWRLRPLDVVKVLWYVLIKDRKHIILGFSHKKKDTTRTFYLQIKKLPFDENKTKTHTSLRC